MQKTVGVLGCPDKYRSAKQSGTTMARNGIEFGIWVSGLDGLFTAQANFVEGLFFPRLEPADAAPDLGASAITEMLAMGDAPAIVQFVREAARSIADLIETGHDVILSYRNGPQVGMIHQVFGEAEAQPDVLMAEAVAISQGYIGYHLQQALREELRRDGAKSTKRSRRS